MMVAIFATLSLALLSGRFGPPWLAITALFACLALSTALFLCEIYSPHDGFGMPWLQVDGRTLDGRAPGSDRVCRT